MPVLLFVLKKGGATLEDKKELVLELGRAKAEIKQLRKDTAEYEIDINKLTDESDTDLETIQNLKRDKQEAEGHPALIDDKGYAVLVTLDHSGATNIYRACYACEYEALTQGSSFDGHPAWGPVWWQPDVPSSLEWLRQ